MSRSQTLILALILLSATLLRVPWLVKIYPSTSEWDEMFLTENAEELGIKHQFKPRWVYYPTMCYYPHAAVLTVVRLVSDWNADWRGEPLLNFEGVYRQRKDIHHVCRTTHGLLGVMTVLLTFIAARRLYSTRAGLWAALLLAWVPYDVLRSQVIKPETPSTMWGVLAFIGALHVVHRPTLRSALIAGFLVGLPIAARYNAAPAIAFPVGVALMTSSLPRPRAALYLLGAGVMSLVAFCLTNPWFLIEPQWYFKSIDFMLKGYVWRSLERGLGHFGIAWMLLRTLPADWYLGWLTGGLFYTTLVPVAVDIARGMRRDLRFDGIAQSHVMVLSMAVGYPLVHIAQSDLWLPHLFLMSFPYAAMIAGHGATRFWDWLKVRQPAPLIHVTRPTGIILTAVLLYHGPSVVYHYTGTRSTRAAAVEWVQAQEHDRLVLTVDIPLPTTRGWLALDELSARTEHLPDATSYLLIPQDAGRRLRDATEPNATQTLLFNPRVRLNGRIEQDRPTFYGDSVAVFRIEPANSHLEVANVQLANDLVWTMAGTPYRGKIQSDNVWTVDPFLVDWGATDLSLALDTAVPRVDGAQLSVTLDVFCRATSCDPTLLVHLGDVVTPIALRCTESWQSYSLPPLLWSKLVDAQLRIEPPAVGPEILFLGPVQLRLTKPLTSVTVLDSATAGTLAAHQLGP